MQHAGMVSNVGENFESLINAKFSGRIKGYSFKVNQMQNKLVIFFCDQCGKVFESSAENKKHIYNCHEEVFKCRQCNFDFKARSDLNTHVEEKMLQNVSNVANIW